MSGCANMASVKKCTVLITLLLVVHCGEHIANGVITDVRLVDGPTSNKGTVEIRQDIGGAWETTCGVNLGINDVIVICRQLGFTGASRAIENTPYGQSSIPTSGLICDGDEDNLAECTLLSNSSCSIAGAASCHGDGYIGCFKNDARDRVLRGRYLGHPLMTISFCIQYCNESTRANYTYAGLENGLYGYCHSGKASDDFARHGVVSDANCQIPCPGDITDNCGGEGYIAVFRLVQSTPPPTTVADTSQTIATAFTPTFASSSGQLDVNTVYPSTPPPTTVAESSTFASTSGQVNVKTEIASTLAVGILLAFVTMYGIFITLMYLHLRRSNIALKQSVSDRLGQELDPYTSLDATTMKQPAYEDIKATRYGNRGHTNAIEGVEYKHQTIVEYPYTSLDATTMKQPAYEDIKATRHGNRGHTNAIEGVEYGNQTIVKQTARMKKSNLGVADENTEPEYELPIEK